jgi:hypothetical protein
MRVALFERVAQPTLEELRAAAPMEIPAKFLRCYRCGSEAAQMDCVNIREAPKHPDDIKALTEGMRLAERYEFLRWLRERHGHTIEMPVCAAHAGGEDIRQEIEAADAWKKGMRRLGPGAYVDGTELHLDTVEMCEALGVPATDHNQQIAAEGARAAFLEMQSMGKKEMVPRGQSLGPILEGSDVLRPNVAPELFPLKLEAIDPLTGNAVWSATVDKPPFVLTIPPFARQLGRKVGMRVTFADGSSEFTPAPGGNQ